MTKPKQIAVYASDQKTDKNGPYFTCPACKGRCSPRSGWFWAHLHTDTMTGPCTECSVTLTFKPNAD